MERSRDRGHVGNGQEKSVPFLSGSHSKKGEGRDAVGFHPCNCCTVVLSLDSFPFNCLFILHLFAFVLHLFGFHLFVCFAFWYFCLFVSHSKKGMGGLVYKLLLLPKTQIECKQSTRKFETMHFLGT